MKLSHAEMYVLRHLHGNTREAREVRAKLRAAGCKFCSGCNAVRPHADFDRGSSGTADGLQGRCRVHQLGCPLKPTQLRVHYTSTITKDAAAEREWKRRHYQARHSAA